MLSPFIIPIFIAHQGCPHQCLFCNQRSITGAADGMVTAREVAEATMEDVRGAMKITYPKP